MTKEEIKAMAKAAGAGSAGLINNEPLTCEDMGYNCCNCGGEGCGCSYCWFCQACENCREDSGPCDRLSDD